MWLLVDDRQAYETRQNALFLRCRPVEQMVEQRIADERARIRTQRGGNLMFGEIAQNRTQRQARPICRRPFRIDRTARRNHIVGVRLGRVHQIRGASLQQHAAGRTLQTGGDDNIGIRLFDGVQQHGPGIGETDRKRHRRHAHGNILQKIVGQRHGLRWIIPIFGERHGNKYGRIHVDAVVRGET